MRLHQARKIRHKTAFTSGNRISLAEHNHLFRFLLIGTLLITSGCAGGLPKEFKKRLKDRPVALFADACHYRANLADSDTFSMEDTLEATRENLAKLKESLDKKGLKVSKSQIPALCASMVNSKVKQVLISREKGSEAVEPPQWPVLFGDYRNTETPVTEAAIISFAFAAPTLTYNNSVLSDIPLIGTTLPGLAVQIADSEITRRKDKKEREAKLMSPEQAKALADFLGTPFVMVLTETKSSTSAGLNLARIATQIAGAFAPVCLVIPGGTELCGRENVKEHRRLTLIDLEKVEIYRQTDSVPARTRISKLVSSLISGRPIKDDRRGPSFETPGPSR